MADYGNPNVPDLRRLPVFSGDPSPGLFYNSMHGPLINPSPDIRPSSSNTGINVDQDQSQVDSVDTDFFIETEDDFSVDWDIIDMEEKQREEKRGRKRIMDQRRAKRLSKGFAVLRSLLPKTGSTKINLESDLSGALLYMNKLKQAVLDLQMELESERATIRPPKVEVITDNKGNVSIHISCEYRPDLLHTVMNSLDSLKIDAQEAIYTCFNGFKLDIVNAKQCNGHFWTAEYIKSMLVLCIQST